HLNRSHSAQFFANQQAEHSFAACFRARLNIFTIRDRSRIERLLRPGRHQRWHDPLLLRARRRGEKHVSYAFSDDRTLQPGMAHRCEKGGEVVREMIRATNKKILRATQKFSATEETRNEHGKI